MNSKANSPPQPPAPAVATSSLPAPPASSFSSMPLAMLVNSSHPRPSHHWSATTCSSSTPPAQSHRRHQPRSRRPASSALASSTPPACPVASSTPPCGSGLVLHGFGLLLRCCTAAPQGQARRQPLPPPAAFLPSPLPLSLGIGGPRAGPAVGHGVFFGPARHEKRLSRSCLGRWLGTKPISAQLGGPTAGVPCLAGASAGCPFAHL